MAASKKPFHTLRNGGIRATVWLNDGAKGPFFFHHIFPRIQRSHGTWRNAASFGLNDLEVLKNLARDAKEWIASRGGMPR